MYYLSADQRSRCESISELTGLDLPAWIPLRVIGNALGYSTAGISAAQKSLIGQPFVWATEFENVHSTWCFEEPQIVVNGIEYKNSEVFYHAQKPKPWNEAHWEMVRDYLVSRNCVFGSFLILISKQSKQSTLFQAREGVMYRAIKAKLNASPKVRALLLATNPHPLLSIKNDSVWGFDASKGAGQNLLAKLWMRLRTEELAITPVTLTKANGDNSSTLVHSRERNGISSKANLKEEVKANFDNVLLLQAPSPRDAPAGALVVAHALDECSAHIAMVLRFHESVLCCEILPASYFQAK
jgi:predicted NAD-dependent protein-ADP-ribosyltransferase YbiA (DUF1768 family)